MGTKLSPVGSSQSGNGVKVYRALLTQTGTDAPVATVLENTLGGDVVWTRADIGVYVGTLAGAFPSASKTALPPLGVPQNVEGATTFIIGLIERLDQDRLKIGTYMIDVAGSQSPADGTLTNAYVQALVNP
jgi:hypothetical protein